MLQLSEYIILNNNKKATSMSQRTFCVILIVILTSQYSLPTQFRVVPVHVPMVVSPFPSQVLVPLLSSW